MRVTGNDVGHFVPENTKHQRTVITTFYLLDRYSVPEESCAMVVLSRKKGREKEAGSSTGLLTEVKQNSCLIFKGRDLMLRKWGALEIHGSQLYLLLKSEK